ncbi:pilus assembly protein [bacterium AH-315-B06]|nr:pilus assembly protein [bacterium AH-315-B06]
MAHSGIIQDRGGNVTLEFAAVIPVLVLLAIGIFEFGQVAITKSQIESAVKAGVQYGTQDHSAANDSAGMIQAALDDIGETNQTFAITARQFCSCPETGELSCSAVCNDGAYSPMFVEVDIQTTKALTFDYPGFPDSIDLSAVNRFRVR